MIIGICRITLFLPSCHSLKEKRSIVRKIKERIKQKFDCSVAEVGHLDKWQLAQLGIALATSERGMAQSMVQKILGEAEELGLAYLQKEEQDYLVYGEEHFDSGY